MFWVCPMSIRLGISHLVKFVKDYYVSRHLLVVVLTEDGAPISIKQNHLQEHKVVCEVPQPCSIPVRSWTMCFCLYRDVRYWPASHRNTHKSTINLRNLLTKDIFVRHGFSNILTKWLIEELGQEPNASPTCSFSSLESYRCIKYTLLLS